MSGNSSSHPSQTPERSSEGRTWIFWVYDCIVQGGTRLSPSPPLHPCLHQQCCRVEGCLQHLTDVLFPASPSFSRQSYSSPITLMSHVSPCKPNVLGKGCSMPGFSQGALAARGGARYCATWSSSRAHQQKAFLLCGVSSNEP